MDFQNIIYEVKDITLESDVEAEPVTVEEVKDYLRLEGFTDEEESTIESLSDFSFDDTLLTGMIKAARQKLERWLGVSIVFHTWKLFCTNGAGDIELPYGPVRTFTSLSLKSGTAVDSDAYEVDGLDFKTLLTSFTDKRILIYDAGYTDVPEEIVLAIKQCVAFWYENREVGGLPKHALSTVAGLKRGWTWLS